MEIIIYFKSPFIRFCKSCKEDKPTFAINYWAFFALFWFVCLLVFTSVQWDRLDDFPHGKEELSVYIILVLFVLHEFS